MINIIMDILLHSNSSNH